MGVAMRIVILILFNGYFCGKVNAVTNYGLKEVVNDVSILARLTNGLSIQSELSRNPAQFSPIVSELLGIGSDALLDTLLAFPATNVSTELNTLFDAIANAQISAVDTVQVGSKINALTAMTDKIQELKTGSDVATVEDLKSKMAAAKTKIAFSKIVTPLFKSISAALKAVISGKPSTKFNEIKPLGDHMQTLKKHIVEFTQDLTSVVTRSTLGYDKLLTLKGAVEVLKPIQTVSEVVASYTKNVVNPKSLSEDLGHMKTDITSLEPVLAASQGGFNGSLLSTVLQEIDASLKKVAARVITPGLPKGVEDVKLIFDNQNIAWLRKHVGDGKSIEKLTTTLKPLKSINQKLIPMKTGWNKLAESSSSRTATAAVYQLVEKVIASGKNVKDSAALGTLIGTLGGHFQSLQAVSTQPNLELFSKLYKRFEAFEKDLTSLEKILDDISASENYPKLAQLHDITRLVGDPTDDISVMGTELTNVKAVTDLETLSGFVDDFVTKLLAIKMTDMSSLVDNDIDWNMINGVQNGLKDTGLIAALENIKDLTFDSDGVKAFVEFADNTRSIKTKTDQVTETKTFLNNLAAVVTSGQSAKSSINQRPTRLRRKAQQALEKNMVKELGVAVQVLKKMVDVLERKDLLNQLTTLSAVVETAIAAVPGGKDVWTDANKQAMKKLMTDVVGLDTFTRGLPNKDLETIWKVFDKAAEVPGVPVDSQLFSDPLAANLVRNPSQEVATAGTSFQTISTLDLNFASNRVDLKAASLSFNPIRAFFDNLLGITRTTGAQQGAGGTAEPAGADNTVVFAVVGGLLGVAMLGGGYGGYWYYKKRKQRKIDEMAALLERNAKVEDVPQDYINRERFWMYMGCEAKIGSGKNNQNTLHLAIRDRLWENIQALIKKGAYVDEFSADPKTGEWMTNLHIATEMLWVECVKELLMAGAATHTYTSNSRTVMIILRKMRESLEEKYKTAQLALNGRPALGGGTPMMKMVKADIEKCDKIKALCESFRSGPFVRPIIPAKLPHSQFMIDVHASYKNERFVENLRKKFPGRISTENSSPATHFVVKTIPVEVEQNKMMIMTNALDLDDIWAYRIPIYEAIFSDVILMQSQWLDKLMESSKYLDADYQYRVTHVICNKNVDRGIDTVKMIARRREYPFYHGIRFKYYGPNDIAKLIELLGGTLCNHQDFEKNLIKKTCSYYPRTLNKRPNWVLHEGEADTEKFDDWWENVPMESKYCIETMGIFHFIAMTIISPIQTDFPQPQNLEGEALALAAKKMEEDDLKYRDEQNKEAIRAEKLSIENEEREKREKEKKEEKEKEEKEKNPPKPEVGVDKH